MKVEKKKLIICIAIPLIGGAIVGFLSRGGMEAYEQLKKSQYGECLKDVLDGKYIDVR